MRLITQLDWIDVFVRVIMKVLVTGANGFIGREIVDELIKNNHFVTGLGRTEKYPAENLKNYDYFQADITDYKTLSELEAFREIDAVIHSAGLAHQFGETSREEFEAVNVKGTENILRLAVALKIKHFILIGSTAVYGIVPAAGNSKQIPVKFTEDTTPNPQTLYAESKLEGENVCRRLCKENKIPLTIFRLAPVIGEANVGNAARLISAIDKNHFVWIGGGANLKTLIYKRDVARACVCLIEKKRGETEIFNLAAEPVTMKDFVNEISANLNKKIFPVKIPAYLLRMIFRLNAKFLKIKKVDKIADTVEKWLSEDIYAADKIAEVYQFKPQTTVSEAVAEQIKYYKTNAVR